MIRRTKPRVPGYGFDPRRARLCKASADDARFEFAIRFAAWADAQARPIGPRMVVAAFGCSRSTAYRWLDAWRRARGESP